jgi:hypothetical protein
MVRLAHRGRQSVATAIQERTLGHVRVQFVQHDERVEATRHFALAPRDASRRLPGLSLLFHAHGVGRRLHCAFAESCFDSRKLISGPLKVEHGCPSNQSCADMPEPQDVI